MLVKTMQFSVNVASPAQDESRSCIQISKGDATTRLSLVRVRSFLLNSIRIYRDFYFCDVLDICPLSELGYTCDIMNTGDTTCLPG